MAYPRHPNAGSQFSATNSKEMQTLMECMSTCRACAKKCTEEGSKRAACVCSDCSEICDLAIKFKSCESEYCQQVWDLCSQICRHCANECSHVQSQHCQECSEVCRRCAEACAPAHSYR